MSVKKHSLFIVMQCVAVVYLYGQQTPQISHYMFNSPMFNPASAGFSNSITASGIHRQQWYGFEGAPQSTLISVDAPLRMFRSGVGLNIANDQIGSFNNTAIQLMYNYQLPFAEGTLGLGIQGGLNSTGLQFTNMKPETLSDPTLQGKDDVSKFLFDMSVGVFYQVPDQYELGVSLNHINQPRAEDLAYKEKRCLNLSGNYHFTIEQFPMIDFVPSTLIKSDFSTMQMDLSLLGVYNKQYWGGISYRLGDAVVLLGGLFIRQIQIGLAYDVATNWMFKGSKIGGGFEVFARYCFNLSVDRLPQSYKNSRYL